LPITHTRPTPAATPGTLSEPTAIALSPLQYEALRAILAALDQPGTCRAIGLFGPAGSGKTTLLAELCTGARRTPQGRRVHCAVLDAARLSAGFAPWQHLILRTLDGLTALVGPSPTIHRLRSELDALAQHEANKDETATLAAAAFAHRFRSSFPDLLQQVVLSSDATFVVVIDHLEAAPAHAVAQLLEASQYFLNGQGCSVLICADEAQLAHKLDADLLARWLTARVALAHHALNSPPAGAALPVTCARLFADILGSDYYAIERASDQWRAATRVISYHQAQGHTIPIPAETLAKLCALKVISPMLFDAACLDPGILLQLERQAQARGTASLGLNGWSEVLARDPRLMRLFAREPHLVGTHASYLLAALRLIQTGDLAALPEPANSSQAPRPAPTGLRLPQPALTAAPVLVLATLTSFVADQLARQVAPMHAQAWIGAASLLRTSLSVGVELAGLALCLLLALFTLKPPDRLRGWAFGLLAGGLASLLFDRLRNGAPANYLLIAQLPAFSLAHLAVLAGAAILALAMLRSAFAGQREDAQ
jgi:lipoprotein signal peptidase